MGKRHKLGGEGGGSSMRTVTGSASPPYWEKKGRAKFIVSKIQHRASIHRNYKLAAFFLWEHSCRPKFIVSQIQHKASIHHRHTYSKTQSLAKTFEKILHLASYNATTSLPLSSSWSTRSSGQTPAECDVARGNNPERGNLPRSVVL